MDTRDKHGCSSTTFFKETRTGRLRKRIPGLLAPLESASIIHNIHQYEQDPPDTDRGAFIALSRLFLAGILSPRLSGREAESPAAEHTDRSTALSAGCSTRPWT
jgi:hypothetical protein